ncbi:hypothetical protein [Paenibacillus sp. SI8]|uniref:hypothetical protein n=1 Tax=unclassified Paenibacillus TaxID=185978 RepID=UPI003467214B
MSKEKQSNKSHSDVSPVVVWEQKVERTPDTSGKIVSIDDYRRHSTANVELEATVSSRVIGTSSTEEPIRMLIVSSGFAQKPAHNSLTVQSMAA